MVSHHLHFPMSLHLLTACRKAFVEEGGKALSANSRKNNLSDPERTCTSSSFTTSAYLSAKRRDSVSREFSSGDVFSSFDGV